MPAPTDPIGPSTLPFSGAITDSLELMKRVWGLSGLPALPSSASLQQFTQALPQALPSMMAPTLDVTELDKRIADLRAVEQWLALNANVLRTTIQSLEVQRNTLAALKSFGSSMLATQYQHQDRPKQTAMPEVVPDTTPTTPTAPTAPTSAAPLDAAAAWWSALQEQFAKVTTAALQSTHSKSTQSERTSAQRATKTTTKKAPRARKSSSSSPSSSSR